jgi:hypothetical protein
VSEKPAVILRFWLETLVAGERYVSDHFQSFSIISAFGTSGTSRLRLLAQDPQMLHAILLRCVGAMLDLDTAEGVLMIDQPGQR